MIGAIAGDIIGSRSKDIPARSLSSMLSVHRRQSARSP